MQGMVVWLLGWCCWFSHHVSSGTYSNTQIRRYTHTCNALCHKFFQLRCRKPCSGACVCMRVYVVNIALQKILIYSVCDVYVRWIFMTTKRQTIMHDPFKKKSVSLIADCMRFFYAKRDNLSIRCNFYHTNTRANIYWIVMTLKQSTQ